MTRIIAGTAGGRRLETPPGVGTRPTSDRVREALFSALESRAGGLTDRSLLDLYAGSGAIGAEALSRGAVRAVMVESDRGAAATIRRNIASIGLVGAVVVQSTVEQALRRSPDEPFDIVVADPPYALPPEAVRAVVDQLVTGGWLAARALVVLERPTRSGRVDWPAALTREGERRYGETTLWYGRHDPATSGSVHTLGE